MGFVRPPVVDDVLTFEPMWREQWVVAIADDHRLADSETIDLAELKDERFVLLPRPVAPAINDMHISICLSYGFVPSIVEQGNSPSALVMVSMGMCVALIPESVQNAGFQGISYRPLIRPTPDIDLAAAYRQDNHSSLLQAFLDTARRVVPGVIAPGRPPGVPVGALGW